MDRIINWLLLVIIFVFDPLAIALVIAANFAFSQLRPKKEYPLEEQVEDMRKVVTTYDALNELAKVQEEAGLYDNEGSDIYTEEDFSDWDSTLQDGLEDEEEWDDDHALNEILNSMVEEIEEEDIIKDLNDVDIDLLADYVKWDQGIDWDEEIESNLSLSEKQRLEAKYDQIKRLDHMNNYDQNQRLYNIRQQINKLNSKKNDNDLTINY